MKTTPIILLCSSLFTMQASDMNLPNPLLSNDHRPITTSQEWMQVRRPELLELFRDNVYGRAPIQRPEKMTYKVEESAPALNGSAVRKQVRIDFSGPGGDGHVDVILFVPQKGSRPHPCFLLLSNRSIKDMDPSRTNQAPFWPVQEIINRGYATAAFFTADIDPDFHDGFTNGVHRIFDGPAARKPDAWGTIAAWAWGASRVLDYLEADKDIDARRVALVGHSRGGKTALWAGAEDQRFAMLVSNESGCTGAAISRIKEGEKIGGINEHFPHWFCQNYRKFNGRENDLPVDQHELLALMAPRLLYVSSASEDKWADPKAEFQSTLEASPVYKLFKLEGVGAQSLPAPEHPLTSGHIGYHLRTGKHDLLEYDWSCFMNFADKFMK